MPLSNSNSHQIDAARQLALVGMMGSGKTRVGRQAAKLLGREFVDLDRLIEQRSGRSIADIFKRQGEAAFRSLEHESLRLALEAPQPSVIATGGGVVLQAANRELLGSGVASGAAGGVAGGETSGVAGGVASGVASGAAGGTALVIWLQASAEVLAKRLSRSAKKRPLLAAARGKFELQAVLSRLLAEREAMYDSVAHHQLAVDELDVKAVAKEVARLAQSTPVASLAG